jgi:hypothetical protein
LAWLVVTEGYLLHEYYQLPLIPFAAAAFGAGAAQAHHWSQEKSAVIQWAILILLKLILLHSLLVGSDYVQDALSRDLRVEQAGKALSQVIPAGAAVVVVDKHPQSILYQADRRGWCRATLQEAELQQFLADGVEYIAVFDALSEEELLWLQEDFEEQPTEHFEREAWRLFKPLASQQH